MIRTVLLLLVVVSVIGARAQAQLVPPVRRDGFVYPPDSRFDLGTILIEAFFDPVCPYSRDAWPPLKQAIHHYGSRVSLLLHLLPLPYHNNAYVTSRALHVVNSLNASATFSLLEGFFKNQESFYNAPTKLLSRPEVVDRIVKLGTDTLGNSYQSVLISGFSDKNSDRATRVSFKYSASRGVYGTPTFYINGFVLSDTPSDFGGWKKVIDPLIQQQEVEYKITSFPTFEE